MGKKKHQREQSAKPADADKPATLKDLLGKDVLDRLKQHSDAWKEEESRAKEEKRLKEEAAKKAEQKRLENDFEYLLSNSKTDWRKFK
ncbi:YqkE family protein [Paenibacillus gansuensis]|uniref:YqkE family protein n=1 Tax=Paenibacillus gansuensis TaxID=306542 RepID=A0ABW5PAZ1_9BACL